MTNERRHLEVRLEVQLRTVELNPDCLPCADELLRIRDLIQGLDLEELPREPMEGNEVPEPWEVECDDYDPLGKSRGY